MKWRWIRLLIPAALLTCPAHGSTQIPAPPQAQAIALTGATLHPVSGPAIDKGTILFDKGRIVALGAAVRVPAGALTVDVAGKHVYPGLIESFSTLGLAEIPAVRATVDYAETGEINPNVRAIVSINPDSEHIPVTRANGVALAVAAPRGGLISGQASLFMLDGWTWEDMSLEPAVGMILNWPAMRSGPGAERSAEQIKIIEQAFRDARAYKEAVEAEGGKGVPHHKRDVRWEAMLPVLKGELPVWVVADNLRQIQAAVDWADRQGVKMVLVGGADSYRAAELLRRKDIPVIVSPVLRLPPRRDSGYDQPFALPGLLFDAGVRFCIAAGPGIGQERNLPYQAAMAAAFGLPKDEALRAVTSYPAGILGVADRVGSLETGKDATLMVTDGDPLEIATQVEKLYIQGRDIDLGSRHKTLYHKYARKYERSEN